MTNILDARLGTWDTYQQQGNPLVVEDGNEWREITIGDLLRLFNATRNPSSANLTVSEVLKENT